MLSYEKFLIYGWRVGLGLAVNFAGDIVVDDPLKRCDFIEEIFYVNAFEFGSNFLLVSPSSLVWFY